MWVCVCRKVTFHLVTTRARLFFRNTRTFFSFGVCVRYIFSPFRPYLLAFQQCHRQRPCASSTHTYRAHRKIYVLGFIYFLSQRFFKANEEASEQHTHTHNFKNFVHFHRLFFPPRIFQSQCKLWCVNRTHARTSLLESFWGSERDKLHMHRHQHITLHSHAHAHMIR